MDDAQKEIENIDKTLQADLEELRDSISKEMNTIKADIENKTKHELTMHESKTLAQARLNAKRKFLEARDDILHNFIYSSVKKLSKDKKYDSFMKGLFDQLNILESPFNIRCNKSDKTLVEKIIKEKSVDATIEESTIKGGIIVEDKDNKRVDLSIDTIIKRKLDELRKEVISLIK